ncbi:helix-turn-helix domain-containing protein [Georgenia halophila]|uniref:helix-turn-helix domain-containing protein n=1 Tax=Georgenia halophila TaxID=620889 RepID=UPI0031E88334
MGDPLRSRFLQPFLGRELSVGQAATELGCSPNAMLYRVRNMLDVDLLRITQTRHRRGRPIKVYRSAFEGYFVPNEAMPYDDLRHRVTSQERRLAEQVVDAYTTVLFRSGNSGRVLARDSNGDVWASDLPPSLNEQGQPVLMVDVRVDLTNEEALHIRDLFAAAIKRGRRASRNPQAEGSPPKPYLLNCAILPHQPG